MYECMWGKSSDGNLIELHKYSEKVEVIHS